jgi:hypothetical protein
MEKMISLSVRFTLSEAAELREAAQRVGWTPTTVLRRAALRAARDINATPLSQLGDVMTPLVLTTIGE